MDIKASELLHWKLLRHLTTKNLDDISFLLVYGVERSSEQGLSALIVMSNYDVYMTGFLNLIGGGNASVLPSCKLVPTGEIRLDYKSVKVDALSGLGLTKIVVGLYFGAALTKDGDLYLWGDLSAKFVPLGSDELEILMFDCSDRPTQCTKCSSLYNKCIKCVVGGAQLKKCESCSAFQLYTNNKSPLPDGSLVKRFVQWDSSCFSLICQYCDSPCSVSKVGTYDLTYCKTCDLLLELDNITTLKFKSSNPHKIDINSFKITNIFCGLQFLILQTVSNDLVIWGSITGSFYQWRIHNPTNAVIKCISCGGDHLAVISNKGELYTCGDGSRGQLGYKWYPSMEHLTLRKVELEGPVVKVCCGLSSTVCLMSDGRVMCFGEIRLPGVLSSKSSGDNIVLNPSPMNVSEKFIDIANFHLTNMFCAKTESSALFTWGYHKTSPHPPRLIFNGSGFPELMKDYPFSFEKLMSSSDSVEQPDSPVALHPTALPVVPHLHAHLFGKTSFSDLTLKLSDGNFPVHRLVLSFSSVYFKETLTEDSLSTSLDMSLYNPKSYKSMLKYFYQGIVDELECDDLFDLHVITLSYKEPALIENTFIKLKAAVNNDTIYHLYTKSKAANATDLLVECENFMRSSEFKNKLFALFSQDMEKGLALLSVQ